MSKISARSLQRGYFEAVRWQCDSSTRDLGCRRLKRQSGVGHHSARCLETLKKKYNEHRLCAGVPGDMANSCLSEIGIEDKIASINQRAIWTKRAMDKSDRQGISVTLWGEDKALSVQRRPRAHRIHLNVRPRLSLTGVLYFPAYAMIFRGSAKIPALLAARWAHHG